MKQSIVLMTLLLLAYATALVIIRPSLPDADAKCPGAHSSSLYVVSSNSKTYHNKAIQDHCCPKPLHLPRTRYDLNMGIRWLQGPLSAWTQSRSGRLVGRLRGRGGEDNERSREPAVGDADEDVVGDCVRREGGSGVEATRGNDVADAMGSVLWCKAIDLSQREGIRFPSPGRGRGGGCWVGQYNDEEEEDRCSWATIECENC